MTIAYLVSHPTTTISNFLIKKTVISAIGNKLWS